MNILDINKRIKQRPPFQMVERVTELEPGRYAKGVKCVSVNEPYFMGHFPDMPVMPGVLIIESLAQLCSLVIDEDASDPDKVYVLLKADAFKFVKAVVPGDTLTLEATVLLAAGGLYKFAVKASVDGGVRAKGELSFTAARKDQLYS
ncbi:MAG TPA: 3-hydroxyacyl-ACP dehydratase FabZ [Firmicutes bacterium]|nr:3-hydroxyacyl-ACP dehydratase FabZ [Bacillota bacterium]